VDDAPIEIGLPERLTYREDGLHLEIVRRWFGPKFLFLTAFTVFWDGFLVFWYDQAIGSGDTLMLVFPLLHVGVGIGLTYYVIAGWLNRTQVYVDKAGLHVRHRPVPWIGNINVPSLELKQLYVKEKESRTRNGTSVSFEVRAVTHGGRNIKIVDGLETQEQAFFIEQKVEKFLGIKDMAVPGELKG